MPFGIETDSLSMSAIPVWVWLVIIIVGLLLCFFGEIIWEFMVSIIGAIIGSIIGYAIGFAVGGIVCAFGLMIVCAIIGSMVFQFLAKVAVALLCGVLAFAGAAYLTYSSNTSDLNTPIIIGLIAGVIVFVIALFFVEEIVGVFLAAIGGFLIGASVYFLSPRSSALLFAALAGISMFLIGAYVQVEMIGDKKMRRRGPPTRGAPPPVRGPAQTQRPYAPPSQTPGAPPQTPPPVSRPPSGPPPPPPDL